MKILFVIMFLFSCSQLQAQEKQYFILSVKGDVSVRQPGRYPVKTKILQQLSVKDSLLLKDDQSVLILANTFGTRTELKGRGSYTIEGLQKKEGAKIPGPTSKFFSFLYEELLHPKKGFDQQSIAASWGGGSRGSCDHLLWPANNIVSSKDSILFKWLHWSKMLNYTFTLYDSSQAPVFSCNLRDSQLLVHTSVLNKEDATAAYYWSVNAVNEPCGAVPAYQIELVSPEEEERRVSAIIKAIPPGEMELIYYFDVADRLGWNGYNDRALLYFYRGLELLKNNSGK